MPPIVALVLCTAFVWYLLQYDRKQPFKPSARLWIPTLWMLYAASKPLGNWFGNEGGNEMSGSPLDRLLLLALMGIGLVILARRGFRWSTAMRDNQALFALVGFMLISIVWSDIMFVAFKRWTREFVAIVMAFVVLTEADPRAAMISIMRRTVYITVPFSILLIKYYPRYGVEYTRWTGEIMWVGVALQKNTLGRLCLLCAFFLFWSFYRRWKGREQAVGKYQKYFEGLLFLLCLYMLKGPGESYPATAIATLCIGCMAFVGLSWANTKRFRIPGVLLALVILFFAGLGAITPWVGGSSVAGFTGMLGRDTTLTGRTGIWADLLPIAKQNPILGPGFGSFWTPETIELITVNECHNGYLDVFMGMGAAGLLITIVYLLSCSWKASSALAKDPDYAGLAYCCLLMLVIHNTTESSVDSFNRHITAVVMFLVVCLPKDNPATRLPSSGPTLGNLQPMRNS